MRLCFGPWLTILRLYSLAKLEAGGSFFAEGEVERRTAALEIAVADMAALVVPAAPTLERQAADRARASQAAIHSTIAEAGEGSGYETEPDAEPGLQLEEEEALYDERTTLYDEGGALNVAETRHGASGLAPLDPANLGSVPEGGAGSAGRSEWTHKPPLTWKTRHVSSWIASNGLEYAPYAHLFEEAGINGAMLMEMKEAQLKKLDIRSAKHRRELKARIKQLKLETRSGLEPGARPPFVCLLPGLRACLLLGCMRACCLVA